MGLFAFALTFGVWGIQKVDAVYLDRSRTIGPSTNIVGSIHVDENGGSYVNGSDYDIHLESVDIMDLQIKDKGVTLRRSGTGYELHYRGVISGQIDQSLKASFGAYGFSIGIETSGMVYISKYVSGTFYFSKGNNQNCDRWGNCVWGVYPEEFLEMRK